ncbi:hypothetical protein D3C78_1267830 [compost metagenome]
MFEPGQHAQRSLDVLHEQALGDFQLQQTCIHTSFGQYLSQVREQVLVGKLPCREVHGDPQVRQSLLLPGHVLLAGGLEHPLADRHDQTGLFGDGDELHRCHDTQVRMVPAQERFHAGNATTANISLGLVVKLELVALQRVAQAQLQRHPLQ